MMKNRFNMSSQFGEDHIIRKLFLKLPVINHYCVEFGAWDGIKHSNTVNLIKRYDWKGTLIEGDKNKFKQLQKTYLNYGGINLVNKYVSIDGHNSLDNILNDANAPALIDLLSIDIDGNDYHVCESLKEHIPTVVIVEFNPSIPHDVDFVQEADPTINHGASLKSMVELGKKKGYEIVAATTCNAIFVHKRYFKFLDIDNSDLTKIWEMPYPAPRVFQLYDGTLMLDRDFKMLWRNKQVKSTELQILPKRKRKFGDRKKGVVQKLVSRIKAIL